MDHFVVLIAAILGTAFTGTGAVLIGVLDGVRRRRELREERRLASDERVISAIDRVFATSHQLIGAVKKSPQERDDANAEEQYSDFASACDHAMLVIPESSASVLSLYQESLRGWANRILNHGDRDPQSAPKRREELRAEVRRVLKS